jgi:hypothetical protein
MSRQENVMQEMKDMILKHHEGFVQQQITQANTETAEVECSMQQLTAGGGKLSLILQDQESEQSRQKVLQELRQQQAAINILKEICEEALSHTVFERTGQKIKGVKATNNSSALAGFINTSGEESKIDQDISDVTADNWSIAAAGVMKNIDFKDMRPRGSR